MPLKVSQNKMIKSIVQEQVDDKLRKAGLLKSQIPEHNNIHQSNERVSRDKNESSFIASMTRMFESGYALTDFEIHLASNTGEDCDIIESRYSHDPKLASFDHICYQMHESSAKIHDVLSQWIAHGYQLNFLACSRGIWFCTAGRNLEYEPPKKNLPPNYVAVRVPIQATVEKEISKYCSNSNIVIFCGLGGDREWIFIFERINFPIVWKWESIQAENASKIVHHFQRANVNFTKPVNIGKQYFVFSWMRK